MSKSSKDRGGGEGVGDIAEGIVSASDGRKDSSTSIGLEKG